MCHSTWQIIFLSSNSFWGISQNDKNFLAKLLKIDFLCSKHSSASYENANLLKKPIGLDSYIIG